MVLIRSRPDWQRLEPLLDTMLDAPPDRREDILNQLNTPDPTLRAELERMLAGLDELDSAIDGDAVERFASLLDGDDWLLPEVLEDRYEVQGAIGSGGTAVVRIARDCRYDRPVAIKFLRPEWAGLFGTARFIREINVTARLQHPNILPLFDSGTADGIPYFVTPYVQGEALDARLARAGPLPLNDAIRIAVEVASALQYAHNQGIVHRDVKPGNILMSDGHAMVTDFGIAKALDLARGGSATLTGGLIGTPTYMAPEQVGTQGHVDGRADIYALGCVVFEMLAGRPPYVDTSTHSVIAQHLTSPTPSLRKFRPDVPAALDAVLQRALAKRPEDRFPDAASLGGALYAAAGSAVPQVRNSGARSAGSGGWLRATRRPALAGLMIVLVAAGSLFATRRHAHSASSIKSLTRTVILSASGAESSCMIADGDVYCWGINDHGQLGNGTSRDEVIPTRITSSVGAANARFVSVASNVLHACALDSRGRAYCWGQNSAGQLGNPSISGSAVPTPVSTDLNFISISVGVYHTCGITSTHQAYCWGWNNWGQLGNPSIVGMSRVPVPVATDKRFTVVTSSYLQNCAIDLEGFAWCWGSNVEGESGTGHQRIDSIPTLTTDRQKFTQVVTGGPHTCGIGESGLTYCWGYNGSGQLGMFSTEKCGREPYQVPCSPRPQPLRTELRFTTLAVGQSHTCGITATGEAYCWGDNDEGQLGDGSNAASYTPVPVNGGFRFTQLSAGTHTTCGATIDGRVYCWGGNQHGQLGDGTTKSSVAPVELKLTSTR